LKYAPVMPVAVVFVDEIVTNYAHVNVPLRCCFPKRDQHCYSRLLNLKPVIFEISIMRFQTLVIAKKQIYKSDENSSFKF
jgi:hypothetical protein